MNKDFNFKLVSRVLGSLLLIEATALLLVSIVPLVYNENDAIYFLIPSLICYACSGFAIWFGRNHSNTISKREGTTIVTFTWIIFSLIGLLPYWLSNSIPSFTDAFFETISGFTTTGASILNNIEELSHGMLFWRSLTHWMGGLGIIVISLAILPMFSVSGTQLFAAESTGPTKDKIHPKINETAKRLFLIYVILTAVQTIFLRIAGMTWFDAINHSFATIATGGFSTKQASIAYFDSPYIQYIIILFMILSGINFSLYYFGFKNKFEKIRNNEELRYFLITLFAFALLITVSLIDFQNISNLKMLEQSWRDALFTVSSLMTTTGFSTADYMLWQPLTWVVLLLVMLTGASAGSTSGGIKMIRVVISVKTIYYEFKKMIHPNAVIPVRYNGQLVQNEILTRVLAYALFYIIVVIFGILINAISGMGFLESVGGTITCLGGVGPGMGLVGPAGNYSEIPEFNKWFLSLLMLAGRLELYTVFLIFSPVFWKR